MEEIKLFIEKKNLKISLKGIQVLCIVVFKFLEGTC